MTLEEIKGEILNLRVAVENLQDETKKVWSETKDAHTENVCDFLDTELSYIAYRLSQLEDIQPDSGNEDDNDGLEIGLQEWWEDLNNVDKASIVGIPAPRHDDRGDDDYYFQDYCDKWWNAKTLEQKQETYKEWSDKMPWWEKE